MKGARCKGIIQADDLLSKRLLEVVNNTNREMDCVSGALSRVQAHVAQCKSLLTGFGEWECSMPHG